MRRGTWILAICGIIGLAAGAGLGDDQSKFGVEPFLPETTGRRPANEYFSPTRGALKATLPTGAGKPDSSAAPLPYTSRATEGASTERRRFPDRLPGSPVTQASEFSGNAAPAAKVENSGPNGTTASRSPEDALLNRAGIKPPVSDSAAAAGENWAEAPRRPATTNQAAEGAIPGLLLPDNAAAAANPLPSDEAEVLEPPRQTPGGSSASLGELKAPENEGAGLPVAAAAAPAEQSAVAASETATVTIEWSKKTEINVGQESECRLLVKNAGKVAARDVTVDAQFPTNVRLIAAVPRPASSSKQLTWTFAEIAAGAEEIIGVRLIPSERGELQASATVRFTTASEARLQVNEPMLALTIKGPKEVMMGDPASQTIMISNPGTGVANNVKIESLIPTGLEHPRGDRLMMDVGSLNPGETRAVRLALAAVEGGQHTIQVSAKADAAIAQNATADIQVIAPSVKLTLEGPSLRYIGRSAKYTLTVVNDGTAPTNNVRVMHRVPEAFQFVTTDSGGKFDPTSMTATWFVGRLEPQQSAKLCIDLLPITVGNHVHRAGVVTEHGTKASAELPTEVDGAASLVLEISDRNDPVEVGTETDYEVRVRNEGSKAASNVALACELPEGVIFIRATGPVESAAERGRVVFRNLDQLEPGKTAVFRIHVNGRVEGNQRFRARLASDSIREPLIFEELTRFYGG